MTHPNFGHSVGPRSFSAVFFCVLLPFKKQETNFLFSLVLVGKQDLDFYVFIHIFWLHTIEITKVSDQLTQRELNSLVLSA